MRWRMGSMLLMMATGRPVEIKIFTPRSFACSIAFIVEAGIWCVWNDTSVPSISRNAALIAMLNLFGLQRYKKDSIYWFYREICKAHLNMKRGGVEEVWRKTSKLRNRSENSLIFIEVLYWAGCWQGNVWASLAVMSDCFAVFCSTTWNATGRGRNIGRVG